LEPYDADIHERAESILRPLFADYQVIEFRGGTLFRGPVSAYCEAHRADVEAGLRQVPGNYSFERLGSTTYLTCALPGPGAKRVNRSLHVLLLVATVLTTLVAGASWRFDSFLANVAASLTNARGSEALLDIGWNLVVRGGLFSLAILAILGTHECGHYFMARRYGMLVTPPFFLPAPFPPLGTFGAVIKMRSPMLHRRALLDIGLAGPLAGFVVALPILIVGILHSRFEVIRYWEPDGGFYFGNSILTWGLSKLLLGPTPAGHTLNWLAHPFAWAGWIGMLVTVLNLVPFGQLDGSHVAYALVGRRQRSVAWFAFGMLLALSWRWRGWIVWCVVITLLMRVAHPPVVIENVPLGAGRRILGWLTLALFVLIFLPVPVHGVF